LDQQHGRLKKFWPGMGQNIHGSLEKINALVIVVRVWNDGRDDIGTFLQHPRNGFLQDVGVLAGSTVSVTRVHMPDSGAGLVSLDRGLDVLFHCVRLAGVLLPIHE
jgi:hypothetical protein